jgi:hypothetical protein
LGIGDWGLGIGDWAQSPIPNYGIAQSPFSTFLYNNFFKFKILFKNFMSNFFKKFK